MDKLFSSILSEHQNTKASGLVETEQTSWWFGLGEHGFYKLALRGLRNPIGVGA
jgi:hypothetical protein